MCRKRPAASINMDNNVRPFLLGEGGTRNIMNEEKERIFNFPQVKDLQNSNTTVAMALLYYLFGG